MANFFCNDGYQYMDCARLFNFNYQKPKPVYSTSDQSTVMMETGRRIHSFYSKLYEKDWIMEPGRSVMINNKWVLHGHIDFQHRELDIVRELKPIYTRRAYGQTLMYRLLFPDFIIQCEEYVKKRVFTIKADYNMAKVYLQRIIYSSEVIPPRLPHFPEKRCDFCPYFHDCLHIPDYSWKDEFTPNLKKRFPSIDLNITPLQIEE
jgi:hypothetical protein